MRLPREAAAGVVAFGLGYMVAVALTDRPGRFVRRTTARARAGVGALKATAARLTPGPIRKGDRVVDVRHVREVMRPVRGTVGPKMSLRDAATLMRRWGVDELVVVKKQRVRGILSARDVVERAVALGLDPSRTTIRDVLDVSDATIAPDAPAQEAIALMRTNGMDRLAVVDASGRIVGTISRPAEDQRRRLVSAPRGGARPPTG
jgi:CBS domain-containing protein